MKETKILIIEDERHITKFLEFILVKAGCQTLSANNGKKALEVLETFNPDAILSCLRTLNAEGGDLKICSLTKPVRALFELVRMHKIFDIFETKDLAIKSFN